MFVAYVGTIRRFLEHYGEELELVVFVTDGQEVSMHMYPMLLWVSDGHTDPVRRSYGPCCMSNLVGQADHNYGSCPVSQ